METLSFTNLTKKGKSLCKYFWAAILFQKHLLPLNLDEIVLLLFLTTEKEWMA